MRARKEGPARAWRWLAAGGVLLVAVVLHASLFWLSHVSGAEARMGDELIYWPEAQRLAAGGEGEQYSPLWPLFYLRFLTVLIFVFGADALVVETVQVLMLFAVAFFVRGLTRQWTGSDVAAGAAAAVTLVYPPLAAYAHYFWPEALHLFLLFGALWILVCRAPRAAWLFTAGLLLGLAVKTKGLLTPFLPVLLIPLLASPMRQSAGRVALVALGVGLTLGASRLATHTPAPVAVSAVTFNAWVGLEDRSRREFVDPIVDAEYDAYVRSAETARERNAILRRKIGDKVRDEGILELLGQQLGRQYFRLFDRESFLSFKLRAKALHPAAPGYADPPPALAASLVAGSHLFYVAVLAGAVVGMAVCTPRNHPWLWVVLAFLAYNLLLFLVLHVKSRYRIQFLPFLFLYFGCSVAWLATKLGWNAGESRLWDLRLSPVRSLAAFAGAMMMLVLAFGGPYFDAAEMDRGADGPAELGELRGPIRAEPNPARDCDRLGLGLTTLHWEPPAENDQVEVRVNAPDGPLFARSNGPDSSTTGKWVRDGMTFYLLDSASGEVVARTTVRLTRSGCPAQ